jgi:hypothetical protein
MKQASLAKSLEVQIARYIPPSECPYEAYRGGGIRGSRGLLTTGSGYHHIIISGSYHNLMYIQKYDTVAVYTP